MSITDSATVSEAPGTTEVPGTTGASAVTPEQAAAAVDQRSEPVRRTGVPALYDCTIGHVRSMPMRNTFSHRTFQWLVDLDRLPALPSVLRPFARFRAADHLGDPTGSIRSNVDTYLATQDIDLHGGQVLMLAHARCLGYVFNPLSVYWCYHRDGSLACIIAEVHNTYGERHCYLLHPDERGRMQQQKEFYVSPFFDTQGYYQMSLPEPAAKVRITMALHRDGATPFVATMSGRRRPGTAAELCRALVRHPASTWWVSAHIRIQGIGLYLRGLKIVPRPAHHPQEEVQ